MAEKFENIQKFSRVLDDFSSKIPEDGITLEGFLDIIGERGLFMSCMILTAPFLLPVSIPGSSIPFGITIFLISIGIISEKPLLIPKRFMNYKISKKDMERILNEILNILTPLERIIKPRLCSLVRRNTIKKVHGAMVAFGAILLVTPILAPLGDFFPSYGILFVCLGTLENDGILILAGYAIIIGTAIYYFLIFALGIALIIFLASHLGIHL